MELTALQTGGKVRLKWAKRTRYDWSNKYAHALTAALAPVRCPVVVGVIAFGLLNPDPVYAPTFQTTPEDRPSLLEAAGETGLAIAVGAAGIKLGQVESAARRAPMVYSVAFETTIPKVGAGSRGAHFKAANEALSAEMKASPGFAPAIEGLGIKVSTSGAGTALQRSPAGWTWHHLPEQPGVMQLVPTPQHQGGPWQPLFHPGGVGGFKLWGTDF